MIEPTNIPPAVAAAPLVVQSTFNAWHIVAVLVGGVVMHIYHTVVNAGGYEMIWRRFRFGPDGKPPTQETGK